MRLLRLLPALLLLSLASPAASLSYDDLFWFMFHESDRSSSRNALGLGSTGPGGPGSLPSFHEEAAPPGPPDLPPYEGPITPLEPPALQDRVVADLAEDADGFATSPVPEPAAAVLFAAGALLVARRVRGSARDR